jgi:putative beta-lysine N-acetyltransferase
MSQAFYEQKTIEEENYYISACFDHFNQRLRVDDYRGNVLCIANHMIELATNQSYSKAIIYSRREHVHVFVEKGFLLEAILEGFYHGSHAYALTMYFESGRKHNDKWVKEDELLHRVLQLPHGSFPSSSTMSEGYSIRKATPTDLESLCHLYSQVFQIYPTPLNDPNYVKLIMKRNTIFYLIEYNGLIVSAASACMDTHYYNAEITDCATLPDHRKHGLMKHLIIELETALRKEKIYCAYSIARSLSFGMNAVLQQLHYKYKGRMTNNCYIFDKLEDMNVWVKDLS